ncbi:MAG: right-handed parallel beta-helix repeat-containing protein, partial [Chitinophagaceae bacterium]|nr:right-handed parallel beta-helix repeat-containing protein [Chitinophagaceae bacterium]
MKKIILLFLLSGIVCLNVISQTTLNTTAISGFSNNNGSGTVTFNFQNTNSYGVMITDIEGIVGTTNAATTAAVWIKTTPINGAPGAISAANGWTEVANGTFSGVANTTTLTTQSFLTGLNIIIPGGVTYGMAITAYNGTAGSQRYHTIVAPNLPTVMASGDGCNIIMGTNISYAGGAPPTAPTNHPRGWLGKLTFVPQGPCTSPPTAGIANSSTTVGCSGQPFNLSLSGNSFGLNQTYQWDSSANGTTWFPMPGDTTPNIVQTQVESSYYRCRVTCSGNTQNSSPTSLIVTPSLVSGNFTINSSLATGGSNFQNFNDAISYVSCGVNGPVNFTVIPGTGPYNGQLSIPAIPGTSSTNRITFKGNYETIAYNAQNTTDKTAITLNGADFVTLDSFNIDVSLSTNAGWAIVLMNGADSNIIRNCNIINNTASTLTNYAGILINGSNTTTGVSGNNGNGNIIENNTITGGYYSVYLYGNSASNTQNNGNIVRNNSCTDFYNYSVYGAYQSSGLKVSKNDFSRPTRTNSTTTGGVFLTTGCIGSLVEKNKIHNLFDANPTLTSTAYGVYIGADGLSGQENKAINNLVYNMNGNGAHYGVYNSGGDFMQAYHNTIVMDDQGATTGAVYGIYQTTLATGIDIKNNIIAITRSGTGLKRCLHFNTNTSTISSNNNVLYLNAPSGTTNFLGQWGTLTYTDLAAWQAANASAYDQQSISVDPLFTNPSAVDFTPTDFTIYSVGVNVGVSTDINDSTRIAFNPGAFRMVAAGCTGTPTPGTTEVTASNVCANTNFGLNLSGNSIGTGLKFTWESSANGTTGWVAISGELTAPAYTTMQSSSTYYRCKVQCNTGTPVYSNVVQVTSPALVNGNFTINSALPTGGTNFANFTDAISYMSCGINGPVTFTVAIGSGPYSGQLSIPPIIGTSSINRITFKGNYETISYDAPDVTNRTAITLNGTDFVTLDSFNINVSASTFAGWGVVLMNGADSNIIRNCNIINNTASTLTNYAGILINGSNTTTAISGNNGNGNIIENNTITGGYYSIYLYGNSASTTQNNGNIVRNNICTDFYNYSVYGAYQSSGLLVSKNDFSRPTRTNSTTAAGVFLTTGCKGTLVEKNKIHNLFDAAPTLTSTTYGVYIGADGLSGQENKVINNLIYNMNGNGTHYGIYNTGGDSMQVYHNTIVMDDGAATTGAAYGIYQTTAASGIEVKNNNIIISKSGTGTKRCLHYNTNTSGIASNNNNLIMNSTGGTANHVGQWGTLTYVALADWQTANSNAYDQQSLTIDPVFANPAAADFSPTVSTLDNKGISVGVLTDIKDSVRSATTPDIGAFEFSTLTAGVNFSAQSLVSPIINSNGCYTNSETLTIKIRNSSSASHDFTTAPVIVNVDITGAITLNLKDTINTGTLASDSTMNVVISANLNMSTIGTYNFAASTILAGDANPANDAMVPVSRTKNVISSGTISSNPTAYCIIGGTPTLNTTGSNGYSSLQWLESNTAGGLFTNISGANVIPYTLSSAISQTKYFKLKTYCGADSSSSTEISVVLNNPQILSSTDSSRCGTGTVTLKATGSSGTQLNWFTTSTGGTSIGTGSPFTTPSISSSTTYYVGASIAGSGSASPLLITELDLGGTDAIEIQNVSGAPFDATGWKVALSNSYTDINSVNPIVQTLSGTMIAGETKFWNDVTGANYWGNNIFWNPGAFPSFSGWAMILDNNNVVRDVVFLNWPSANIQSSNIVVGTPVSIGTNWTGNGIDQTTVAGTQSISRKGSFDNNDLNDFEIVNTSLGALNPNMSLPFGGFSCDGPRSSVVATVHANPSAVVVTPDTATQCTNSPAQVLKASGGEGAGSFVWSPTTGLYTDAAATVAYTGGVR